MAKITNGTVTYERSVKVADYENKKFGASFSFIVDDGEDAEAATELFGRQIVRFVEEKLGLVPGVAPLAVRDNPVRKATDKMAAAKAEKVAAVAEAGNSGPPPPPTTANEVPDEPAPRKPGRPKGSTNIKPAPKDEPETAQRKAEAAGTVKPEPEVAKAKAAVSDEIPDEPVAPKAAPAKIEKPAAAGGITDAQLREAVTLHATKIGSTKKVRELIQTFFDTPSPEGNWKAIDIPPANRAEFLEMLSGLA